MAKKGKHLTGFKNNVPGSGSTKTTNPANPTRTGSDISTAPSILEFTGGKSSTQIYNEKVIQYQNTLDDPSSRLTPADEYYVMARPNLQAAIEKSDVISKPPTELARKVNTGIDLNLITSIVGIPPVADNVADPPVFALIDELSGGINAFSTGRVGKEYTRRVLERGQFLTLTPLELEPDASDMVTQMLAGHGTISGIESKIDGMIDRLNITSYGFKTKVANKRYWRSVVAHMKTAMYSLGIDNLQSSPTELGKYVSNYLPRYMVEFITATSDLSDIRSNINSSLEEKDPVEEAKEAIEKAEPTVSEINSGYADLPLANIVSRGGSLASKGMNMIKDGVLARTQPQDSKSIQGDRLYSTAMYSSGFEHMMRHIANIDINDATAKTMPFTVFYVNGPIDRQMSFSLEAAPSKLAHNSVTAIHQGLAGGVSTLVDTMVGGNTNMAFLKGDNMQEMITEFAYHRQGKVLNHALVPSVIVPKVMTGGSADFSYTIPIREVSVSSDRFSLLRVAMAWCLLAPYVLQPSLPKRRVIIPTSALYCAAFSKGVINAPRAYISNMTVKTDTAFQTTFGAPTELDFTITLQPVFTVATMPDFNKFWGAGQIYDSGGMALIQSMWNPMSSLNILATMCGQNTVLTSMPKGLTEVFITGRISSAITSIKESYSTFKAVMRDYTSNWTLQKNNMKLI